MLYKKHITIFLIGLFLATFVAESYSQRRSSRSSSTRSSRSSDRDTKEVTSLTDKLTYEILLGNPFISNQFFELSGKLGVGYKVTDFLAFGAGPKWRYSGDTGGSNFIYGPQFFGKVNLGEQVYIRGEYDILIRKNFDNITSPLAGLGYVSGFGKWKYGLEVLLPFNADYRQGFSVIDYMFSFVYNM